MPTPSVDRTQGQTAEHEDPRPPFGAPHVFVLAVIDGDQPNSVHRIVQHDTVIGRGEEANIDLNDEKVSKRHCMLRVEGAVCMIQDLGSLNGTRVNGRRMRDDNSLRLRHLDEIQVGSTRLFVLSGTFKRFSP